MTFAFSPKDRATYTVSASTVTATTSVNACNSLRIVNSTAVVAFIRFGTATATSADVPMLGGTVEVFNGGCTRVDVLLASGTGSVYITEGEGV